LNLVDPAVRSGVRVAAVDGDITVSGTCLAPLLAGERFVLHQNRPNPFNPRTEIQFEIPSEMDGEVVTLEVYDVFQRRIATFIDGPASRGLHTVAFDGSNYPSGMYFYALEWRGGMVSRRMLLAK
jgi:hypothetical protein